MVDTSIGNATAEFLGGRTYYNTTDIDPNRPNYLNDTDRDFWGTMVSYQFTKNRPFLYFLHHQY